jgi:acetolactate synthase-1/3 small subunit
VLNRVVSVFRRRTFNIESLTVGQTHLPGISRMTIVVDSDKTDVDRIMPYMYKLINVLQVEDLTYAPRVSRDLAMVKISATPENRADVMKLAEVFRARVVDVTNTSLIIEITGNEEKIDGFVDVLRPYGIIEMVRTGIVAMERGTSTLISNQADNQNFEIPVEFKMVP